MAEETVSLEAEQAAQAERIEICTASLEAAREIAEPLLAQGRDGTSVLYAVWVDRKARMTADGQEPILDLTPALIPDPTRSGLRVERYRMQGGSLPDDASGGQAEQFLRLWAGDAKNIPPLRVPDDEGPRVMRLADAAQMRGQQARQAVEAERIVASGEEPADGDDFVPVIYAREEVGELPVDSINERTQLHVHCAARGAIVQRITSALAVVASAQERGVAFKRPILATADATRVLLPAEREFISTKIAPDGSREAALFARSTNEYDLAKASAFFLGFREDTDHGTLYLPDGSSYMKMVHEATGTEMIVLVPSINRTDEGKNETGLFNAYHALDGLPGYGEDHQFLGDDFRLGGSDVIAITSTHYGTMATINNLAATFKLRTKLGSFHVVGDNQPARTDMAHLVEVGLTLDAIGAMVQKFPPLRRQLLRLAV